VPEASVDEDDQLSPAEDDVGTAPSIRQHGPINPESQPAGVKGAP
jgi:hypothetical protein